MDDETRAEALKAVDPAKAADPGSKAADRASEPADSASEAVDRASEPVDRALLKAVDPACANPAYWDRFRAQVMEKAAFELATRRRRARTSVETVLTGWSRSLIPLAVAAALVAAFLAGALAWNDPSPAAAQPSLALEDVLESEVGDGFYRTVISGTGTVAPATFMTLVEAGR